MFTDSTSLFCSTLSLLDASNGAHLATLSELRRCAPPPLDAAGLLGACAGAHRAARAALAWTGPCSPETTLILQRLDGLARWVGSYAPSDAAEVTAWPARRLARHAAWATLSRIGHEDCTDVVVVTAGLFLLRAWLNNRPLPQSLFQILRVAAVQPAPLELTCLDEALVRASREDEPSWLTALRKHWPQMQHLLGMERAMGSAADPSGDSIARSRWMGSRDYPGLGVRDLTFTHRQLSERQLRLANDQIGRWIAERHPLGAFAAVSAISGLTIEQVGLIRCANGDIARASLALDLKRGWLMTDIGCLAPDAGLPPAGANCLPATSRYATPLPQAVARYLQQRICEVPRAQTLGQLLEDFCPPSTEASIVSAEDAITPSWARWHNSLGILLRRLGVDSHVVGLVTKDFGHSIKSKAFYSRVRPDEVWNAAGRLFEVAGWGPAQDIGPDMDIEVGVGCALVPPLALVRAIHEHLKSNSSPADHTLPGWARNLNAHARRLAFVLSILLALREAARLSLGSDFDERVDPFMCVHDKSTPSLPVGGPLPLGKFLRRQITEWRTVCSRGLDHARGCWGPRSPAAEALHAIANRSPGALLCLVRPDGRIKAAGTWAWRDQLPRELWISPDAGRKLLENELRLRGVPTHAIDAILRHERTPASRQDSASDFILIQWLHRMESVQDQITAELFAADLPR